MKQSTVGEHDDGWGRLKKKKAEKSEDDLPPK